MRKIISGMFMTLDGVIEAPETWNPPYYDDELNQVVLPQLTAADTHLYGRRSYELFRAVFTGPSAPPHAEMMTSTPKVVVSATLDNPGWGPTTVIRSDVATELTKLTRHGLQQRVIAVQAVRAQTGQFNRAFDDDGEYRSLREAFVGQAEAMLGLGIDVIIPACGYPMLLFAREESLAIGGATVLNGLPVAVAAAETAIRLSRLNGTGTSRRAAYALPPSQAVTDFRSVFTAGPPHDESASAR